MSTSNTEPVLPLPADPSPDARTFITPSLWFVDHDGYRVVFCRHEPIYRVALADMPHLRYVCVMLRQSELATQAELARAFGHSVASQRRWERHYEQHGLDGLVDQSPSGRPRKLDKAQEEFVRRWFLQGASKAQIARRLGVGEATVQRTYQRLGLQRPAAPAPELPFAAPAPVGLPEPTAPTASEQPLAPASAPVGLPEPTAPTASEQPLAPASAPVGLPEPTAPTASEQPLAPASAPVGLPEPTAPTASEQTLPTHLLLPVAEDMAPSTAPAATPSTAGAAPLDNSTADRSLAQMPSCPPTATDQTLSPPVPAEMLPPPVPSATRRFPAWWERPARGQPDLPVAVRTARPVHPRYRPEQSSGRPLPGSPGLTGRRRTLVCLCRTPAPGGHPPGCARAGPARRVVRIPGRCMGRCTRPFMGCVLW